MADIQDLITEVKEGREATYLTTSVLEDSLNDNRDLLESSLLTLEQIRNVLVNSYEDQRATAQRMLEREIEGERLTPFDGAGVAGDDTPTPEAPDIPALIKLIGGLTTIAGLAKMTGFDDFIQGPAALGAFIKTFTGFFGKVAQFTSSLTGIAGSVAKFLTPLGTLFSKIAIPITIVFGVLDAISGFTKAYADTGSVVEGFKGALAEVVDGLIGSIVRIVGDIASFVLEIFGLDQMSASLQNFTGEFTERLTGVVGGLFDVVIGFFETLFGDPTRLMRGLSALWGNTSELLIDIISLPIDLAINFFRDIFGFGDEDMPDQEFSLKEFMSNLIDDLWSFVKDQFSFELPSFDTRNAFHGLWSR